MNIVLGVLVGLLVLTLLVVIHEGGHFLMARKNGVRVKEFGIGFPPRAIAWVKGKDGKWHRFYKKDWQNEQDGLIFSINWLPIGGFCSMDGESDADTRKGTFGASTFWQKTKILFGGVLMNWLAAIIIFTVLAFTGLPRIIPNQFHIESDTVTDLHPVEVTEVIENSPADKAGLKAGDLISVARPQLADNSTKLSSDYNWDSITTEITDSYSLSDFNTANAGKTVVYTVYTTHCDDAYPCDELDGLPDFAPAGSRRATRTVTLNTDDSEYLLGVRMKDTGQTRYRSTWSAPLVGIVTTVQLTGETFKGLGNMVVNLVSGVISQFSPDEATREQGQAAIGAAGDSVAGPVGILGTLFPSFVSSGITNVAFLAAIISISLACMNVLPIPALDGGRWLLIAIYKIRKKPLDAETESRIISRAMLILLALAVLITVLDVIRIAS